ncbi:redoxin domain-containing protein [Halorussus limi]|uniref:Redoxin domain-containing protein n=1 Tax=Halorussus limi TaxID=2938695 RepID=A0A8U0HQ33_9EURY|nr:redoxin domain-containing protein [Halorussus limi]UPV72863.1 redoxin domain-containing protein [Halorussus limi]
MVDSGAPTEGSQAPEFTAPLATPDGSVSEVSLSSLRSDGAVLLVFQPTDFDVGSFAERHALGEYDWFTADDRLRVVGVNRARPRTNREFADYLEVTYPFCSDRDLSIADAYGVTYRAFGVARRARPACFFVDREGTIRYRWVGDRNRSGRVRPRISDLYEVVMDVLGRPETESFGFA